jgi:hypothetical protein
MSYDESDPQIRNGALWAKVSSAGNRYLAGNITLVNGETHRIIFFPNDKYGDNDKPDYCYYGPSRKWHKKIRHTATNNLDL